MRTLFTGGRPRQKWNIIFINILVLRGGVQRPQVYTKLQALSHEEQDDMAEMETNPEFIQMRTGKEKTNWSLRMPFVLLPFYVVKYLQLRFKFFRPVLIESAGLDISEVVIKPLFLHT